MSEEKTCQATKEELKEVKRKCQDSNCDKMAHFELFGWRYCFKHWRMSYKYGCEIGLWRAIKWTKLINLIKNK